MTQQAIYFVPDISGFTDFVTHTEIEHGKHIISELLELLLDNNNINLKLAEIEGDALFMYTLEIPELGDLIEQSKEMLKKFNAHLLQYKTRRICNCGACLAAPELKLKFIVHYGEISFMRVKKIIKPYGREVIKTHRLLKNSVPFDQYFLVTKCALDFYKLNPIQEYPTFVKGNDQYDFGSLNYFYLDYSSLTLDKETPHEDFERPLGKAKFNFVSHTPLDIINSHKIISSFEQRTQWYTLVDYLIYDEYRINRGGAMHNCISGANSYRVKTLTIEKKEGVYTYAEQTHDIPDLKNYCIYFTLTEEKKHTRLELNVYFDFETKDYKLQERIKRELYAGLQTSIKKLTQLCDSYKKKSKDAITNAIGVC